MTILAICRTPEAIVVGSDAVAYDPRNGIIVGFASKVMPILELGCFLANTGISSFSWHVRAALGMGAASFDELLSMLPEAVRSVDEGYTQAGYPIDAPSTVFAGGWSDARGRMELYKVHTRPRDGIDLGTGAITVSAPFELHPAPDVYRSYNIPPDVLERFGIGPSNPIVGVGDLCAKTVRAARACSRPPTEAGGDHYAAGGFLQLSILQRQSFQTSIVHRWPERIGDHVDPTVDDCTWVSR